MKINASRRSFNQALLSIGATAPMLSHSAWDLNWLGLGKQPRSSEYWLSAQGQSQGQYGLGWVDTHGEKLSKVSTPFRGHGFCQNPTQLDHIIMFSRRPGTEGIRLNLSSGKIDTTFRSAPDRHMHGHGCFSADGTKLFCAESEISTGKGKISIRDTRTLTLIGEFDSYGIGPHEIALMPDGNTLVVANGGLLTHPDSGREILNLNSMRASLAYIDIHSGELLSEHFIPEKKTSIRHLDVANDGTVAIALQVQRKAMGHNKLTPLAAIHKQGQKIILLQAPEALLSKLNDYMGSVKINNTSRIAAFASPKGNLAMFWHLDDLSLQGYHSFHDVCGLAVSQDNKYFVLSNSTGKIRQINAATLKLDKDKSFNFPHTSWDNHMITVLSSNTK
jgi:hypothetical protein